MLEGYRAARRQSWGLQDFSSTFDQMYDSEDDDEEEELPSEGEEDDLSAEEVSGCQKKI